MLRAYFDTNVYDAIEKGTLHGEDVEAIRVALKRREIVAPLSLSDIEELLGQWDTDRPATIRRLRVAGDLVGFDGILKQPSDLLRDAFGPPKICSPDPPIGEAFHGRRRPGFVPGDEVADESGADRITRSGHHDRNTR